MKRDYVLDDFYFSVLYGRGIYQPASELSPDPLSGTEVPVSPLLLNLLSGERYFLKILNCKPDELPKFREQVQKPAPGVDICWPSDMIAMDEDLAADVKVRVANYYDVDDNGGIRDGQYALLFHCARIPAVISWNEAVQRGSEDTFFHAGTERGRNWRNPNIRKLAVSLVETLYRVNRNGYAFFDFHKDRLFLTDDADPKVYFGYSNLIYSLSDLEQTRKNPVTSPDAGCYPVEYAEPAYVRNNHPVFDLETQNYSLCAFLFRLFYGRYAYDGEAMSGRRDYSEDSHYLWFRDYYKHPIFLFEPDNQDNGINEENPDDLEQILLDLWNDSPGRMQEMFIATLKQENADRRDRSGRPVPVHNPTPEDWLALFSELGWIEEKDAERRVS